MYSETVTVLSMTVSEYTNNYIQTHDCIQRIADTLGTSTERRMNIDNNYAEDAIILENGMAIIEVCDPEKGDGDP